MKTVFKPLGIAAAVAAVTAGYAGAVSAQAVTPPTGIVPGPSTAEPAVSSRAVGDLALIPYYSVQSGFATAVHIINTTEATQVVKLRARRGLDSADSLDFNLVMSPKDEWVGSLSMEDDGAIVFTTNDKTCTAPAGVPTANGGQKFIMPDNASVDTLINYREGAEEGYIEVIGMAQPTAETYPIAVAAKHVAGVPRDCTAVRSNFFRVPGAAEGAPTAVKGVHYPDVTAQTCATVTGCENVPAAGLTLNTYVDTQNDAFKVSWAVTDGNSGLEFGSNAVHLEGFAHDPMMTNQQVLIFGSDDPLGYLFPDLNGGSPLLGNRGQFEEVRAALGASSVENDWSSRDSGSFTVATDWVVTMPGQYLMVDPLAYVASLQIDDETLALAACNPTNCDYRDIPVGLSITYYDREEGAFTPEEGGLVVSPAINLTPDGVALPYEVNVVEWKKGAPNILESQYAVTFEPLFEGDRGWADLSVTPNLVKDQAIWDYAATDPNDPNSITGAPVAVENVAVPIIGFAVWERNFANNPNANYGRAIDHSYGSAAAAAPAP
jgi:hypothetical protein